MIISLFLLALIAGAHCSCMVSPRHWCDTIKIARSCGVEAACLDFLWPSPNAKPVNVSLYYESLCPDCIRFMKEQFFPTWMTFKSTGIMHVDIIPYGNANEVEVSPGYYNFTCQHGPKECTGNLIENCILKYQKYDADAYMPIIHCIESADNPISAAEKCVTDGKMDWNTIDTCSKGKEGNALMHKSAQLTDALQPPHNWVPWITINGVHTDQIQQEAVSDLAKLLCDSYTGVKPQECRQDAKGVSFYPT